MTIKFPYKPDSVSELKKGDIVSVFKYYVVQPDQENIRVMCIVTEISGAEFKVLAFDTVETSVGRQVDRFSFAHNSAFARELLIEARL
jgi:hypothetical protein